MKKFCNYLMLAVLLLGFQAAALAAEQKVRDEGSAAFQRGDYTQAFQIWESAANKGDHRAQFLLSSLYSEGKGIVKDEMMAAKWLLSSASGGFPIAQFNLGNHYYNGVGIEQSYEKAVEWWSRSARQGFAEAQYNLGVAYVTGKGVKRSDKEGVRWLGQAAIAGSEDARKVLELNGVDIYGAREGEQKPSGQGKVASAPRQPGTIYGNSWLNSQPSTNNTIQVLGTVDRKAAESFASMIARDYPAAVFAFNKKGATWYAVVVGSYAGKDAVNRAMLELPLKKWRTQGWIRSFGSIHKIMQSN